MDDHEANESLTLNRAWFAWVQGWLADTQLSQEQWYEVETLLAGMGTWPQPRLFDVGRQLTEAIKETQGQPFGSINLSYIIFILVIVELKRRAGRWLPS